MCLCFLPQAHLTEHQTIHSNLRPYLCEICGASFKTRSVQRKHIQTIHRNPRSFICTHCSKRFNTRYALRRHETTHHATQPQATDGMMLPGEEELATQRIEVMKLQDRDSTKVQILGTQQVSDFHVKLLIIQLTFFYIKLFNPFSAGTDFRR